MSGDSKLLIPVYLNQRIVFDMIAMLQGGISTVTSVSTTEQSADGESRALCGSFGVGRALSSLLKIGLSAETNTDKIESEEKKLTEERIHTPASLFYTLRNSLKNQNFFVVDDQNVRPTPGAIVEFQATLKRNPVIETMDAMSQLMDLATSFGMFQTPQRGKKTTQRTEYEQTKKQIESFSKSLKVGDSIDLTTDDLKSGYKAIVTIERQYLNDPLMSDLVDGKFNVLGKVIRSIPSDNDAISLIRKSAISRMPSSVLTEVSGGLQKIIESNEFDFPKLEWEIKGPVIQVIPISIFS